MNEEYTREDAAKDLAELSWNAFVNETGEKDPGQ